MQRVTVQDATCCGRTREKAQFPKRGTINTTLADLVAAVAEEVKPQEEELVVQVVLHILRSSRIARRVGPVKIRIGS